MTIGIIGSGNMGSALGKAFLKELSATDLTFCDLNEDKLQQLQSEIGCNITTNAEEVLSADVVMLAVKPQGFSELAQQIKGKIRSESIVLSIMTGISIQGMKDQLDHQKIIRTMPNTPALVGEGMIVWKCGENIFPEEKSTIQNLLQSAGKALEVEEEDLINAATSVTASGAAYVFALAEAWIEGAKKIGFSEQQAEELIFQTLKGGQKLLTESEDSPGVLREKVTSKGGTTEAALKHLNGNNWNETFSEAVVKAYERAKELSQ